MSNSNSFTYQFSPSSISTSISQGYPNASPYISPDSSEKEMVYQEFLEHRRIRRRFPQAEEAYKTYLVMIKLCEIDELEEQML